MRVEDRSWNFYLAQPCFVNIVQKQYDKRLCFIPLECIEKLYAVWEDGLLLGKYCEATKDAEGS